MSIQSSLTRIRSLQKKLNGPPALFLDYDGTLVPIARRPQDARLSTVIRGQLRNLARRTSVAIISGRSLSDVRSRVGLTGVAYAGNHGLEIAGRGFRYQIGGLVRWRRFLKRIRSGLKQDLAAIPGILIEDKGCTMSVHYRLVKPGSRRRAERLFINRMAPIRHQGLVRLSFGKAVWEIRPPLKWDKGSAVLWLLKQKSFHKRWPLYIGDDFTDQDAFRIIRGKGIGIAVGSPRDKGAAHETVKNPQEVHRLMSLLGDHWGWNK